MSLLNMMSGDNRFMKVHVNDIRPNPLNFYRDDLENEDAYVADMADMIAENGQDANGIVYEDTALDDGKRYTLIAGERRWKAIMKNFESGKGDGMYEVKIIPRPADNAEEMLRLIRNNAQRNKSVAIRKSEVESLKLVWEDLVAHDRKPEGRMREWIAKNIGMSPRAVQEYLTGDFSHEQSIDQLVDEANSSDDIEEYDSEKEKLKLISKNLKNCLGIKARASKKKNQKCTLSFQLDDFDQLVQLLYELGCDEEGNKL